MSYECDAAAEHAPNPTPRTISLDNPWMQNLYRWYQAKKKYSPPLIDIAEQDLIVGKKSLDTLWSDPMKTHPEAQRKIAQREQDIVTQMKKNQAIITRHYASLNEMKRTLIQSGFLDGQGQSLYE